MKVLIESHYDDTEETVEGSRNSVYAQLISMFPWLHSGDASHVNDVEGLIEQLDSSQFCSAQIVETNEIKKAEGNLSQEELSSASEIALDMIGFNPQVHPAFAAAKFLTGGKDLSLPEVRRALYDQDSDYYGAALQAYNLEDTEANRKALKAISDISDVAKSEGDVPVPAGKDIEAGTSEGKDTTRELRRAFRAKQVRPVHLNGKHSKGCLIAKDAETENVYLLKPGSGGQSPAAGAEDEPASQSRREAAFWHMADAWGIGSCIPKADLVLIDGTEFAAIRMLPFSYKSLEKKAANDQGLARKALAPYRNNGIIHKWAVLDFVLGNPDRHGQNLMVSEDNDVVALIDHGSAFAGSAFDPAYDQNSFVPYYLRAWASPKFNQLSTKKKLEQMPSVSDETKGELREWLDGLHADRLEMVLNRYGIDPRPSLARLAKVKTSASSSKSVDEAINRLWVTT